MAAIKKAFYSFIKANRELLTPKKVVTILIGTAILSFGLHNIHRQADVTEGGVLGMILLLNHWFGIGPALVSLVLNVLCYAFAFKTLGKDFLKLSAVSTLGFAGFFLLWEQFPPMLPNLSDYPLVAAIAGGAFVGVGVGLVIRQGGSTSGDDALALTISKLTGCRISFSYLATDIAVLLLSLTYIPFRRIGFSIMTVLISSLLIGYIKDFSVRNKTVLVPAKEQVSETYLLDGSYVRVHQHGPGGKAGEKTMDYGRK